MIFSHTSDIQYDRLIIDVLKNHTNWTTNFSRCYCIMLWNIHQSTVFMNYFLLTNVFNNADNFFTGKKAIERALRVRWKISLLAQNCDLRILNLSTYKQKESKVEDSKIFEAFTKVYINNWAYLNIIVFVIGLIMHHKQKLISKTTNLFC